MRCPICGNDIANVERDYLENVLMEETATCEDDGHFYGFEYVTGNLREVINDVEIIWAYGHPAETVRKNNGLSNEAIQEARRIYSQK